MHVQPRLTTHQRIVYKRAAMAACQQVKRAVDRGLLPNLKVAKLTCVDCGINPATEYDHREYARPLDVSPVCLSCNLRRPPATFTILGKAEDAKQIYYTDPDGSENAMPVMLQHVSLLSNQEPELHMSGMRQGMDTQTLTTAKVLDELRALQGLQSLSSFASKIGLTASWLCDIYSGRRQPSSRVLKLLGLKRGKVFYRNFV